MKLSCRTLIAAAAFTLALVPSYASQSVEVLFRAKPVVFIDRPPNEDPGGNPGDGNGGPGDDPVEEVPQDPPVPVTLSLGSATLPDGSIDNKLWEFDFKTLLEVTGIEKEEAAWSFAPTSPHPDWLVVDAEKQGFVAGVPASSGRHRFDLVASHGDKKAQRSYVFYVNGVELHAVQISAGSNFTCAVTVKGAAKCWGSNANGQLGNNSTSQSNVPVDVQGLGSGVAFISAGAAHACAVTDSGAAYCWGSGAHGRLGNGSLSGSLVPVQVINLGPGTTISIDAGTTHTCAVTTDRAAKCWGYGRLGDGTVNVTTPQPVTVQNLEPGTVRSIVAGPTTTCAVTVGNSAKCWGLGAHGRLATGTLADQATPASVAMADGTVAGIAVGQADTCLLSTDGKVKCYGNQYNSTTGVNYNGLQSGVTSIAGGTSHFCAVQNGTVRCFGTNSSSQLGQVGQGTSSLTAPISGATAVTAGEAHTCAILSDETAMCWGLGSTGQLGNGANTVSTGEPQLVKSK